MARCVRIAQTYSKEAHKVVSLQIACLGVGELGPNLLERAHLLSSDGLRPAGHLEDIVETLDDNTSEQVGEDVLSAGLDLDGRRREPIAHLPC